MKDSQLSKTWAVHRAMVPHTSELSPKEWEKLIGRISRSAWWKREWTAHRPMDAVPQLQVSMVSAGVCVPQCHGGVAFINAMRVGTDVSTRRDLVIMHQVAHLLVPETSERALHGIEWARAQLMIVRRWMGQNAAKELRHLYTQHKVRARVIGDEQRNKSRENWYRRQHADGAERAIELMRKLRGEEA